MPYEGIRIIDFSQVEQGPAGTQVLADFGAEVIKVEKVNVGEIGRALEPKVNGVACFWAACNRNKKSLTLDLKKAEGKEIILKLVRISDVVASNFRPGVMERLGFGYEDLKKINPRIICAYASGFGETGPYRDKRGQDLVAQAMGGLMALTGESGGPPTAAGTFVADFLGAMLFAQGIMVALAARERSGEGQKVDTCLLNAMVAVHIEEGTTYLNTGKCWPRPLRGLAHSHFGPLYGTYQTKDGRWLVIVDAFVEGIWKRVCTALGLDRAMAEDPRFQPRDGLAIGAGHEAELRSILEEAFAKLNREEAIRLLEEQEIICGPVHEYSEVFTDPQVIHNEMILEIDHPLVGRLKLVGMPVKLSRTPGTLRLPPPTLGQHNEEILSFLGYTESAIRLLQEEGVVGSENVMTKAKVSV
jgi:crotonobetainyl-CoA:carnitine CoA-transferase CaiB-like acyl-CoA transferase